MLTLNWGFVFTIINILVLYILLKKFLFGPVVNIMEQRDQLIRQQLDAAKTKESEATKLAAKRQEELLAAEEKADAIVVRAKDQAKDESEVILKEAGTEARRLVNEAMNQIDRERDRAMRGISTEIAGLAVAAAEKAIGGRDNRGFDQSVIDEFLKEEGVSDDDSSR